MTLECPELKENILEAHQEVMEILTRELRRMIPLKDDTKTLVIGLGNRQVTADALGPLAVSGLLVTRHLYAVAPHELKDRIRPVSAIAPGVMGQTGVETGELVAGLTDKVKPDVVIAIDALASRADEPCQHDDPNRRHGHQSRRRGWKLSTRAVQQNTWRTGDCHWSPHRGGCGHNCQRYH